eukprot:3462573-Rhodomonas_salina.2
MDIAGEGLEVVELLLRAQVSGADDTFDLLWLQQRLELFGDCPNSLRDVHIADHKHEHYDLMLTFWTYSFNSHDPKRSECTAQAAEDGAQLRSRLGLPAFVALFTISDRRIWLTFGTGKSSFSEMFDGGDQNKSTPKSSKYNCTICTNQHLSLPAALCGTKFVPDPKF